MTKFSLHRKNALIGSCAVFLLILLFISTRKTKILSDQTESINTKDNQEALFSKIAESNNNVKVNQDSLQPPLLELEARKIIQAKSDKFRGTGFGGLILKSTKKEVADAFSNEIGKDKLGNYKLWFEKDLLIGFRKKYLNNK